jgi:hypothetical protein
MKYTKLGYLGKINMTWKNYFFKLIITQTLPFLWKLQIQFCIYLGLIVNPIKLSTDTKTL